MYGDKISQLRRDANLTQGQLGDLLNVSAQAVSKWEHNLSEPDLATVKRIANIFNISMDDFLDINIDSEQPVEEEEKPDVNEVVKNALTEAQSNDIGVCTNCGCKVTKDNVGVSAPKILCDKCARQFKETEDAKNKVRERAKQNEKADLKNTKKKSIIWGSIVAFLMFIFGMWVTFSDVSDAIFTTEMFFFTLFLTYASYAFVAELIIDDGPVADVLLWFVTRPIRMPGVIFTLDLGGLLFLLLAKVGLAILGFLLGIICFLLGLFIGLIIAPFTFPFTMYKVNKELSE